MSFKYKILALIPLSVKKGEIFNRAVKYYEAFKYRKFLKEAPNNVHNHLLMTINNPLVKTR